MKHPLGSQQKKLQMSHETHLVVSRSANITNLETFPENTFQNQQLEHTLGGFKNRHVHFVVICWTSTDLNGSRENKKPRCRTSGCLAKTSSKSHFLPSFVGAKPLPSAWIIPIRGGNLLLPQQKTHSKE